MQALIAQPLEVAVEALVQLLRVDPSLVGAEVRAEESRDDGEVVGREKAQGDVVIGELAEVMNLSDGGHAAILVHCADIP
ncbi:MULTISPECIES: hypothetical protein [unclassified Rathayibacter]|uniref:hypothetical protein n=1 Tax=unclassified Rathayibacter TaxID=2609250 RepID=UPI0010DCA06B|nr:MULTISPECIES: hypothetical protein [unclassified Rathayibacter]TCL77542.1 hypothetical protein EDF49_11538 [Rathayibacter sp. PhB192]TCM29641.1 hypothetical protein EDF43_103484 [Rathayibacter sp. PhB179]